MTGLQALDAWIGRKAAFPLVAWLCRKTRQGPFAVSRMFWLFAGLSGLWQAESPFWQVVWLLICLFMLIAATRQADRPVGTFLLLRLAAGTMLVFELVSALSGRTWSSPEFWAFVLLAEYAACLGQQPPNEASD